MIVNERQQWKTQRTVLARGIQAILAERARALPYLTVIISGFRKMFEEFCMK
jgi:hypothetical protein